MPSIRFTVAEFLATPDEQVLGRLAQLYADLGFSTLLTSAIDAWRKQIGVLRDALSEVVGMQHEAAGWSLLLEYVLPMRDRRPDAVLLAGPAIFVMEFKVGAESHDTAAMWQVQSYALDLRDFHPGCRGRPIVPILVATDSEAQAFSEKALQTHLREASLPVQLASSATLGACLSRLAAIHCGAGLPPIDPAAWDTANFSPTPSIIEAAQALFGGHTVGDISHAFSDTLEITSKCIVDAIEHSQRKRCRSICLVTGIPGSGKTLVGLNAVHSPSLLHDNKSSAIFLSGNGPLVKVIREALAREQARRGVRKEEAKGIASAFIANVHGFLKLYGIERPDQLPAQHAIVFDEAQRAWSAQAVKEAHGLDRSESAMVLDIMERLPEWATVVALVGGGQEINKGEAGLPEWGRASRTGRQLARSRFTRSVTRWRVRRRSSVVPRGNPAERRGLRDAGTSPARQCSEPSSAIHWRVGQQHHFGFGR